MFIYKKDSRIINRMYAVYDDMYVNDDYVYIYVYMYVYIDIYTYA